MYHNKFTLGKGFLKKYLAVRKNLFADKYLGCNGISINWSRTVYNFLSTV